MEVDTEFCGVTNLAAISDEDRDEILKICRMTGISVSEFGNYLDAVLYNNSDWPLKDCIKSAQTDLNKKRQAEMAEIRKVQTQKKTNYSFEKMTEKL